MTNQISQRFSLYSFEQQRFSNSAKKNMITIILAIDLHHLSPNGK